MPINTDGVGAVVAANKLRMDARQNDLAQLDRAGAAVGRAGQTIGEERAKARTRDLIASKGGDPRVVDAGLEATKAELIRLHGKEQADKVRGAMDEPAGAGNPLGSSFQPRASALPSGLPPTGAAAMSMMPGVPDLPAAQPPRDWFDSPGASAPQAAAPAPAPAAPASSGGSLGGMPLPDLGPPPAAPSPAAAASPLPPIESRALAEAAPAAQPEVMLPPTGPLAPSGSAEDRRSAYWRRIAKTSGLASPRLGPETNLAQWLFGAPAAPESETEVELKRAQAAKAKRDAERPFDVDPLSPEGVAAQKDVAGATHPVRERNIDPNSPEGIAAAKARRKAELEADKEMGGGDFKPKTDEPKGLDAPLNPAVKAELVKRHPELDPAAMNTRGDLVDLGIRESEITQLIKTFSADRMKTDAENRLPTSDHARFVNSLDEAEMLEYESLVAMAQPHRDRITGEMELPSPQAKADLVAFIARVREAKGLDKATGAAGGAKPAAGGPPDRGPSASPDAPTPEEQSLIDANPQMKAAWASYTTPEARAAALASLRKKRAAAGK